jgi:hypothetical protein
VSEEDALALGPPKWRVAVLPRGSPAATAAAEALAARLAAQQPHLTGLAQRVSQPCAAASESDAAQAPGRDASSGEAAAASTSGALANGHGVAEAGSADAHGQVARSEALPAWRVAEAAAAAADFRRLGLAAAGSADGAEPAASASGAPADVVAVAAPCYGPWRPYLARLAVNLRLTAPQHFQVTPGRPAGCSVQTSCAQQPTRLSPGRGLPGARPSSARRLAAVLRWLDALLFHGSSLVVAPQDTRHLELDLGDSGLTFEPGDSLTVLPM